MWRKCFPDSSLLPSLLTRPLSNYHPHHSVKGSIGGWLWGSQHAVHLWWAWSMDPSLSSSHCRALEPTTCCQSISVWFRSLGLHCSWSIWWPHRTRQILQWRKSTTLLQDNLALRWLLQSWSGLKTLLLHFPAVHSCFHLCISSDQLWLTQFSWWWLFWAVLVGYC